MAISSHPAVPGSSSRSVVRPNAIRLIRKRKEPDSVRGFVELPPVPISAARDLHEEGYEPWKATERGSLRVHYFTLLLRRLADPLRVLPKDVAVAEVIDVMNTYSISQADFDTIVELSKILGHPNPLEGIPPAVKAALTRAYNERSKSQMVRAADLVTLPGARKTPKKRIAAILELPVEGEGAENGEPFAEGEEEEASDTEDKGVDNAEIQLQLDLEKLNSIAIKVQLDLKGAEKSGAKKTPAGRGKGGTGTSA